MRISYDQSFRCVKIYIYIRGIKEIAVFEVELKKKLVKESFDHSREFFQCKAYYYEDDIHDNDITGLSTYDLNDLENGVQQDEVYYKDSQSRK